MIINSKTVLQAIRITYASEADCSVAILTADPHWKVL